MPRSSAKKYKTSKKSYRDRERSRDRYSTRRSSRSRSKSHGKKIRYRSRDRSTDRYKSKRSKSSSYSSSSSSSSRHHSSRPLSTKTSSRQYNKHKSRSQSSERKSRSTSSSSSSSSCVVVSNEVNEKIMLEADKPKTPPPPSLNFSSVEALDVPVMPNTILDIDADEFIPKTFTSSKKLTQSAENKSSVLKSEPENQLFHANFLGSESEQRWIKKLFLLRQKISSGKL